MTRTVLITGASSGIGKATARHFAERGWNVIATLRNPADLSDLPAMASLMVARLDVQDRASILEATGAGIARFGRIDALVNNAGFSLFGTFEGTPREKILEQFEVNLFGLMDVTRALLPHFRANREGTVIMVGSRSGLVGMPLLSLYCASKYALEGFSESLAFELASQNIAVKLVDPAGGVADTKFPERVARDRTTTVAPPDYAHFIDRTAAAFNRLRAVSPVTAAEVAAVIHGAASDGTDRLRYIVGVDSGEFLQAKREMSDQDYVDFMRNRFANPP